MSGSAVVRFKERGFSHMSVITDDVLLPVRDRTASRAPVQIYTIKWSPFKYYYYEYKYV